MKRARGSDAGGGKGHTIDLRGGAIAPLPLAGYRCLGGRNPSGHEIGINDRFITRDGVPWLPVMGEFHFSRFPHQEWNEELLKVKAGGVQIVSSYLFWIHHEESPGRFDWSGDRDLRAFVGSCARSGLLFFARIGPWCHGECRNGGFPDWVRGACETRTDDPVYLDFVRRYFAEIALQLRGLLYKDGGPTIGLQIENELVDNPGHLKTLKAMAVACGLEVPLYTATGWCDGGEASIPVDEMVPAFGCYPDHPWEQHTRPVEPREKYHFTPARNDAAIGNDLYPPSLHRGSLDSATGSWPYPYLTCELGPGVQNTYHRRHLIAPDDVGSLALVKLGSGVNLMGYYVFHGGSNPIGLTTLQESRVAGSPNDLPIISYDFQAPLGEFGQVRPSFRILKCLHLFLNDFGELLAPLPLVLPDRRPSGIGDRTSLRWAARGTCGGGYLFFNNHQRGSVMPAQTKVQVELHLGDGRLRLPQRPFTLRRGAFFLWPFNMDVGDARLEYATAQPLCRIRRPGGDVFFFFAVPGVAPEYAFAARSLSRLVADSARLRHVGGLAVVSGLEPGAGSRIELTAAGGTTATIVTLSRTQALNAWKGVAAGEQVLVVSASAVVFDRDELRLYGRHRGDMDFLVFPEMDFVLDRFQLREVPTREGIFLRYRPYVQENRIRVTVQKRAVCRLDGRHLRHLPLSRAQSDLSPEWEICIPPGALEQVSDVLLSVEYVGSVACAYLGERLIDDHFYDGAPWEIGLRRFRGQIESEPVVIKVAPRDERAEIYVEKRPSSSGRRDADIVRVRAIAEQCLQVGWCNRAGLAAGRSRCRPGSGRSRS